MWQNFSGKPLAFWKNAKRSWAGCMRRGMSLMEKLQTGIDGNPIIGRINYTVWSDVFICPTCSNEIVFWDAAVDKEKGKVNSIFFCPYCRSELTKRNCVRAQETHFDTRLNKFVTMVKQVPVLINYSVGKKNGMKTPDEYDLALIDRINNMEIPYWYPTDELPKGDKNT